MCKKQVLKLLLVIVLVASQVHGKQQNQQTRRNRNSGKIQIHSSQQFSLIIIIRTNLQSSHILIKFLFYNMIYVMTLIFRLF